MNMTRNMIKAKNLSNDFWDEVVACSIYRLNKSPIKSVKYKVSQEAWSGKTSNLSHLKFFGCIAYAHVPEEIRRKIDRMSEK
jgi:hypothetical protein